MTDRKQYILGLRDLADMLEAHPEFMLPYEGGVGPMCVFLMAWEVDDPKSALADHARLLRRYSSAPVEKDPSSHYFNVTGKLGGPEGLHIDLVAKREEVCERVIVGTKVETKLEKDPALLAQVPEVEVEHVTEEVEWRCRPLLEETEKV